MNRPTRYLVGLAILAAACTDNAETPLEPTAALSSLGAGVRVITRADDGPGGDAGLKLREKGDGNLVARLVDAVSLGNRLLSEGDPISGILLREDEEGDLRAELVRAIARRNGGDGIALEENEGGDLSGQIRRSIASSNHGAGASLAQEPTGAGQVTFSGFTAPGNGGGPVLADGVEVAGTP